MIALKTVANNWKKGMNKGNETLTDIINPFYQSRINSSVNFISTILFKIKLQDIFNKKKL